ncbi:flagellar protein [Bacillus sp. M6-12]|uniref:TIGR02530 family flagellar biosynthesis protein n=1 Tax=Bacillus sp. M6-12 TaxID=2054166 RepID=UPI000C759885|nr:TIGR02530 family flagellar biosynthesis protein [Bacillus sp. M6-12]PLS16681.1 flagellar protein [Bacillus sp. M6-12]
MKKSFRPISQVPIQTAAQSIKSRRSLQQNFSQHLQSALDVKTSALTVSKHAQMRLDQRNITIDSERWAKVEEKIGEARKLGVKDSLVLLQDAALIVSAKNNTVITAMDRDEASSQIFTNINGTIILDH